MKTIRSCHELGVCHGRPSVGCTCNRDELKPFAPGVIQVFKPQRLERVKAIAMEVLGCLLVAAVGGAVTWLALQVWQVLRAFA